MLKFFTSKKYGGVMAGVFVLLAAVISTLPGIFKSDSPPTTSNVIFGDNTINMSSFSDLEQARLAGRREGEDVGFKMGVKMTIWKDKEYNVPIKVTNKMFPLVNGLTYQERQELSKINCSIGSVTARDICHFDIMKTGKKGPEPLVGSRYSQVTEENDVRTEEEKQKGYGQLNITIRRYGLAAPKLNGDISAEERILRNTEPWYLACNQESGCRLLNETNLVSDLTTIRADERVIKGAQVNKSEWFADYRLRMTGFFLQGDLIPMSPLEIKSLIKSFPNRTVVKTN